MQVAPELLKLHKSTPIGMIAEQLLAPLPKGTEATVVVLDGLTDSSRGSSPATASSDGDDEQRKAFERQAFYAQVGHSYYAYSHGWPCHPRFCGTHEPCICSGCCESIASAAALFAGGTLFGWVLALIYLGVKCLPASH